MCSGASVLCPLSSVIRFRKAPLNGRRLVPKTRVTARSEVRFLSLPPIPGIRMSGIRDQQLEAPLDP